MHYFAPQAIRLAVFSPFLNFTNSSMRVLRTALLGMAPLLVPSVVVAQSSVVTGRILDARGEAVIGANVVAEGTTTGAAADIDGNYRFSIAPGTYRIAVTAVGYARQVRSVTLRAGETATQNFTLTDAIIDSDEVVVTGAGTATSRRELTIDVGSVDGGQVDTRTTPSLSTALIGKIPGVQITESATPGSENLIILRGINSFGGGQPLLLVDGVAVANSMLTTLDPATIERVEVIKGAAAASLYGAQGANGVIQVFLKRGQAGRTVVTASQTLGASSFVRGNFAFAELGSYTVDANGNISGLTRNPTTRLWSAVEQLYTPGAVTNKRFQVGGQELALYDPLDQLYQTGVTSNTSVSVSGGAERLTYFTSYGYTDQRGIELSTGQRKHALRVSVSAPIVRNLSFTASATVNNDTYRNETASGNSVLSGLGTALNVAPYVNLAEPDSMNTGFQYRAQHIAGQTSNNPFFDKEYRDANTERTRILGSLNMTYRPFRVLELAYTLGLTQTNLRGNTYQFNVQNLTQRSPILTPEGSVFNSANNTLDLTSRLVATLRSDLQRDLGLSWPVRSTTSLAYEYSGYRYRGITAEGTGLPPIRDLRTISALTNKTSTQYDERFLTYGGYVNQKFDFGEIAGVEAGVRADQSSAFRAGEGVEYFPRAGAYFRFIPLLPEATRERLTEGKLRFAFGSAGIQPGAYQRITTLAQGLLGSNPVFITPGTLSNPDLTVARSEELEVGADFNYSVGPRYLSAIGLTATYWTRSTVKAISVLQQAPSTGSTGILDNGYTFDAQGVDLGLQLAWLTQRNFAWSTTFNFSKQNSVVSDIAGTLTERVLDSNGIPFLIREGEDVGAFFGQRAVRSLDETNPATGQRLIPQADEGFYAFVDGRAVDVRTQRVLFRPYRELLGTPTPDFVLTMRNDFDVMRYLTVGIQFDWNQGGNVYNATRQRMYQYNRSADNTVPIDIVTAAGVRPTTSATSSTQYTGPQAYANYYQSIYNTSQANEFFVEDGTFVKLRELSFVVRLSEMMRGWGVRNVPQMSFTLAGRNLLTFSDYKGFDPEVNQGGVNVATRGYDYFTYPQFRTWTGTLNLTF